MSGKVIFKISLVLITSLLLIDLVWPANTIAPKASLIKREPDNSFADVPIEPPLEAVPEIDLTEARMSPEDQNLMEQFIIGSPLIKTSLEEVFGIQLDELPMERVEVTLHNSTGSMRIIYLVIV